ncbi:mannosyltransferase [Polaribacter pectinis]|uniref:Mannosyltransferase n=1 Tax=Polaribacter pectinis TaxID=2738844 RepID=A0A7G9LCA5_9FLAO|nr:glycosyltransferase [Polaribacter pectinis]QNM86254.1 mannosyltransferase [Polaribacter pectinis]
MIPKIIHYCWFGNNEKPEILKKCILSWEKNCKDYKIIEWNETNSSQFTNSFYKNSLRKRKYAFVSDYIRTKALYEFGGIYLDTDMLLLKPIDKLLEYNFFSGLEVEERVAFGLFGGIKKHRFFSEMLDFYSKTEFDEFNPPIITHSFKNLINSSTLKENEVLLSPEYFYPLTYQNKEKDYKLYITDKSYAVHLWNHSWKLETKKGYSFIFNKLKTILLDYILHNYSFKYLKNNLKETLINLYRLVKYKSI